MFANALIGAACAALATCVSAQARAAPRPVALAQASSLAPTAAQARSGDFTPIGAIGAFRLDAVRRGTHGGVPVRFLDFTLKNTGSDATFPRTLHKVWWQGRLAGEAAQPLRRDGSHFGMWDQTVDPGRTLAVTYAIPDREDVAGVTLSYPHVTPSAPERVLSWDQLAAATRP